MAGAKENTFAEIRGVCILRLTALTRLTGAKACESKYFQVAVIQYIIFFFNQKVKLYMYRVLSTFGYEFQVFPESVNVCQRLSTHDFSWMCLI